MSGLGGGLGQTMVINSGSWDLPGGTPMSQKAVEPVLSSGSTVEVQTITVTDIISEGPISGLVNGASSVFLNDDNLFEQEYVGNSYVNSEIRIRVQNNSKDFTITRAEGSPTLALPWDDASKFVDENPRVFVLEDQVGTPVTIQKLQNGMSLGMVGKSKWALKDPDGGSNWWDPSSVSSHSNNSIASQMRGIVNSVSTYRPVRLVNHLGETIPGIVEELSGGSNYLTAPTKAKFLEFTPGHFKDGSFVNDAKKYKNFHAGTAGTLFVDRPVIVTKLNKPTSTEQTGTLKEAFTHVAKIRVQGIAPTGGSGTINIPAGSPGKTGDEVRYRNNGSGNDMVGLTDGQAYFMVRVTDTTMRLANTRRQAYENDYIPSITNGSGLDHDFEFDRFKFIDYGHDFTTDASIRDLTQAAGKIRKMSGAGVQFRAGHLQQSPMKGPDGVAGATSITNEINEEINQSTTFGGDQAPITLTGTSSNGFNVSSAVVSEADEIRIRFKYAGGLKAVNSDGDDKGNWVRYRIKLRVKTEGSTTFGPVIHDIISDQSGKTANASVYEEIINLSPFRPFLDFQVTIHRTTDTDKPSYLGRDKNGKFIRSEDWQNISRAQISNVTTVFKERLVYPLTAVAKIFINSKAYGTPPTRSYHCRGMIVKVPSNYVTREETGAEARYTRRDDRDSGVATHWDGTFRLAYTNNPAWIFYDMLTNNRYGLGDFIKETDIDKYSLYKIGRYCDEMVPDGKGGTEPRYVMNTYLTKSTDAYKVLKDMATNFLGMIYYLNGKIFLVQDSPKAPTQIFSKSNVIDGAFQYESTGSKTRTNQIQVIWNNPENNFRQEPLIVEDRRNISETGNIINREAVAFGCTSEGQATRYGKWKLWTSINQNEIVSFMAGPEGSFVSPGDIIIVQDSDRHSNRLSGRISAKVIDNLTETATYSGAIGASVSGFTATQRAQPAVFSGIAVLPSSFSNSAEALFEHGGTGSGTLVGMVDVSGTKKLIVRSGHGTAGSTASDANQVVKLINISDIPEFDDQSHRVTLEVHPTATGGGSVRFWIDNRLVVDETTTGSNFNSNQWSGGDEGGWGQRGSNVAGYDGSTTPTNSNFQNWSGTLHTSLSVYSNQTVSTFPTTTTIPLDASTTLNAGSTYELSVIFSKNSAFNIDSTSPSYQVEQRYQTSSSSNILNMDDSSDLAVNRLIKVGMSVSGSGIAANTTVTAVGETTVTLNQNGNSNFSNSLLTFSGGTYSSEELVTHAYVDHDGDGVATFQVLDTLEKASNAMPTPTSSEFLNLDFVSDSRVEKRGVTTSAGTVTSLTVDKAFSEVPQAEAIWVLVETASDFTVSGSGKEYKVLSLSQERNEQYSIAAVEHYDEKFAAVEETFSTYVEKSVLPKQKQSDVIPLPQDAWVQRLRKKSQDTEDIKVHWTFAKDPGVATTQIDGTSTTEVLRNTFKGQSAVEITHTFEGQPSPLIMTGRYDGLPEVVFKDVTQGLHFIELRTITDLGKKSLPVTLEVFVDEKQKRRNKGFFPGALHGGSSSTRGTEIV